MATAMGPFAPYSSADPEHTPLVKSVSRLYTLEREPKGGAYALSGRFTEYMSKERINYGSFEPFGARKGFFVF